MEGNRNQVETESGRRKSKSKWVPYRKYAVDQWGHSCDYRGWGWQNGYQGWQGLGVGVLGGGTHSHGGRGAYLVNRG